MRKKIQLDDFAKNNILTNLKVNENQTIGLYFSNQPNIEENTCTKNLILCDLEKLTTRVLDLSTEWDDYEFVKDEIVLKTYVEDHTAFYIYNIHKNQIKLYAEIPYIVKRFCIFEDTIYFVAKIIHPRECECIDSGTRFPLYEDGKGFIGNRSKSLFKMDIKTQKITCISPPNTQIDDISFDLYNDNIVFTAFDVEVFKPVPSDIYTYNLTDESITRWTDGNYRISYAATLSKGKIIFLGIDLNIKQRNDNHELYVIEMSSGKCRNIENYSNKSNESFGGLSDMKFSVSRSVNYHNGNFYFLTLEKTRVILNKINKDEEFSYIDMGINTIECYQILKDSILLVGLKGLKLHELYKFQDGRLNQITNHNEWLEKERRVSKPFALKITDKNIDIDGWVIPPINIRPNQKYPAILIIHGGPKLAFTEIYHHGMQTLAANGYYVIYANPMGSDGYGDEFLDIRGSFGNLPYDQLINFTDEVIKKYPQIDKANLGLMGSSYGGYMTNYIIGKTSKFKAAISESGISNLVTAFTSSDIGYQYVLEYMGGETPWTNMDDYIEQSPIVRADKVTAATLFIHGKDDHRCNYTEALNMYAAISYHGVNSKLCIFEGESHDLGSRGKPKNRYNRYKAIIEWFDCHLKEGD